jgi:hypothetical protein
MVLPINKALLLLSVLIVLIMLGIINIVYILICMAILIEIFSSIDGCSKIWSIMILVLLFSFLMNIYNSVELIKHVTKNNRSFDKKFQKIESNFIVRNMIKQILLIIFILIGIDVLKNIKNNDICYIIYGNNYDKLCVLFVVTICFSVIIFLIIFCIMKFIKSHNK